MTKLTSRTYSSVLHQVCDHDNNAHVLLPDHPPEVLGAGSQWTLSSDIGPGLFITLRKQMHTHSNVLSTDFFPPHHPLKM